MESVAFMKELYSDNDLQQLSSQLKKRYMLVCLHDTLEEFRLTWGGKLLAALRTLHIIYIEADGAEE